MDILKVYPSGRVTASRRRKFNPDAVTRSYELTEQQEWDKRQLHLHGLEVAIAAKNSLKPVPPLGLSSVPNLSTDLTHVDFPKKNKRGSGGITSRSRQQVKDAATLMEAKYGRSQLSFITHTIPPSAVTEVHKNWVKILANLRRRYIRALQKANLPQDLVMVTEYQEERLAQSGHAVLHLHIVIVGREKKRHWSYDCEYYKQHWRECCQEFTNNAEDNQRWIASTRVESIRKSCANYLGKYMSKGVSTLGSVLASDPSAFIPSSWHILSQKLRVWVRISTRHYEGRTASELFDWLTSEAVELMRFNRYIKIPTEDGRGLTVGWYGDLKNRDLFN